MKIERVSCVWCRYPLRGDLPLVRRRDGSPSHISCASMRPYERHTGASFFEAVK